MGSKDSTSWGSRASEWDGERARPLMGQVTEVWGRRLLVMVQSGLRPCSQRWRRQGREKVPQIERTDLQ